MKMSLRNELEVVSWNKIQDYVDEDAFFIFDEQRLVGKGAWVKAFWKIAANQPWILLTATPADVWVDLMPVFVANGFFENQTEFNTRHVIWARFVKYPKIDGYYDEHILAQMRDAIYVEMPHPVNAEKFEHHYDVGYNRDEEIVLHRDRWNFYEDQPIGDAAELMRLLRINTNLYPGRLEKLKELIAEHKKVIVFYNLNPELEALRVLHTELDIPVAEWNGHVHQPVPQGESWVYLVQYQAGSEGWNCVTTNHVVSYSYPYSYRNFAQSFGRIDRMNTPFGELHHHVLESRSIFDTGIKKAIRRKKNFQASAFARRIWPKEEVRMMRPPV